MTSGEPAPPQGRLGRRRLVAGDADEVAARFERRQTLGRVGVQIVRPDRERLALGIALRPRCLEVEAGFLAQIAQTDRHG